MWSTALRRSGRTLFFTKVFKKRNNEYVNQITSIYLKAVLDPVCGLRTGNVLSSVGISEIKGFDRLILFSDVAMNPEPNLKVKKQIIENAVKVARAIGINMPKVALISAKEKVDPKVPSTLESKQLEDMNKRGEITDCIVAGLIALDLAISEEAC